MSKITSFLTELNHNNNREWFQNHKSEYEQARKEFIDLVNATIQAIGLFDAQVHGLQAKASIFRLYRDVRFSKDKRPYKTHFGAYMAEGGRKSPKAGYYLHIEADGGFLGGGLFRPAPDALKKVRMQIDYNAAQLRNILKEPTFVDTYGKMQGQQLKTSPRDFSADHPDIDLLRYKDFFVSHPFHNSVLQNDAVAYFAKRFTHLKPLNDYLNQAIAFDEEEPQVQF
jgi:uncharacterized protein (TIGR02453 family)